jgi:hypothetical protein
MEIPRHHQAINKKINQGLMGWNSRHGLAAWVGTRLRMARTPAHDLARASGPPRCKAERDDAAV